MSIDLRRSLAAFPALLLALPVAGAIALGGGPARAALANWGPPVLCHPISIGDAPSLPFGHDAFALLPDVARDGVGARTLALLDGGDDALVHMETLRRAVLYMTYERAADARVEEDVEAFVQALEGRQEAALLAASLASEAEIDAARSRWGLCAFDLSWTLEGLAERGLHPRSSAQAERWLQAALAARPADPALRLGASVLCFARGERQGLYLHLDRALAGSAGSELLSRNIAATMGRMLGAADDAELAARVARELGRA